MTHYVVHKAITPDMAQFFIDEAPKGKLNNQTIHDEGEGNLVGYVAEQYMLAIYTRMFPDAVIKYEAATRHDYDIILNGHKIDVKAKMRTAHGVRSDWDVSIAEYTIDKQHCDSYAFCSVTFDRDKAIPLHFYYVGMLGKQPFVQQARRLFKGHFDGDNILPNGKPFKVRKDCRNLKFIDLKQYDADTLSVLKKAKYNITPLR